MSPGIWTEPLTIRSYDVDFRKRATPEAICRYFLEAAWNHAEALGVGYTHLAQQNRFWVLARLLIQFKGSLQWRDPARLNTWPRPTKSVLAMREFEILDANDRQIVGGSSCWLVLDAQTRKPQRIDSLLSHLKEFPQRLAIDREPAKLNSCNGPKAHLVTTAKYSDIDINDHVNSGRYIAWVFDSFPLSFHLQQDVISLELNYIGETRGGDLLSICSEEGPPGQWSHSLLKQDGTEVCRARTQWAKRP